MSSRGKCYRCGREGHWASKCYARSHANGGPVNDKKKSQDRYYPTRR